MKSFFQRILSDSHSGPPEPPPIAAPKQAIPFPRPRSGKEERSRPPTSNHRRHEEPSRVHISGEKHSSTRAGPTLDPHSDYHGRAAPNGHDHATLPARSTLQYVGSPPPLPPSLSNLDSYSHPRPTKYAKGYEPPQQGTLNSNLGPHVQSSMERGYKQMDGTHWPHKQSQSEHPPSGKAATERWRPAPPKGKVEDSSGRPHDKHKYQDVDKRQDWESHGEVKYQQMGNGEKGVYRSREAEKGIERKRGKERDVDTRRHQKERGMPSARDRERESDRERETDRERDWDRDKKERENERGRERNKEIDKVKNKEKERERTKERERERERGKEREKEKERAREKDKTKEDERGRIRDLETDMARISDARKLKDMEKRRDDKKGERYKGTREMKKDGTKKNGYVTEIEEEKERYGGAELGRNYSAERDTRRGRDMEQDGREQKQRRDNEVGAGEGEWNKQNDSGVGVSEAQDRKKDKGRDKTLEGMDAATRDRPLKQARDGMNGAMDHNRPREKYPNLNRRREPAKENDSLAVRPDKAQPQGENPSGTFPGKPAPSLHKRREAEKPTQMIQAGYRESVLAVNSVVPPLPYIQPTLASSSGDDQVSNVPETAYRRHLPVREAGSKGSYPRPEDERSVLQAAVAYAPPSRDSRFRRAEITPISAPPVAASASVDTHRTRTRDVSTTRTESRGDVEAPSSRTMGTRWSLTQDKGRQKNIVNAAPVHHLGLHAVKLPGVEHSEVQQRPPSRFVDPGPSSHINHYEERAQLSTVPRVSDLNTSHRDRLKVDSRLVVPRKSDLHDRPREDPPMVTKSYPASTATHIPPSPNKSRHPLVFRDDSTNINDETSQRSTHIEPATAARKDHDQCEISTDRLSPLATPGDSHIAPPLKNPSPLWQPSKSTSSNHELSATTPTIASPLQPQAAADQPQVSGTVDPKARVPASTNVSSLRSGLLYEFSSARGTSSANNLYPDPSQSALRNNHASRRNELDFHPSSTHVSSSRNQQLQVPLTTNFKELSRSSNSVLVPQLVAEFEAQSHARDANVDDSRSAIVRSKKRTREDADTQLRTPQPAIPSVSHPASIKHDARLTEQQTKIPSRSVHPSITLGVSSEYAALPNHSQDMGGDQRMLVGSENERPSVSHLGNTSITGSVATSFPFPVPSREVVGIAEMIPSLSTLQNSPNLPVLETPASRPHTKESLDLFPTAPNHLGTRVPNETVNSRESRQSNEREDTLTSENQRHSQRNGPSERLMTSLTTTFLGSQPTASTEISSKYPLLGAPPPSQYPGPRNAEQASYLPVSRHANAPVTQESVQYENMKADQASMAHSPLFQHPRLADILSSPIPTEQHGISSLRNAQALDLQPRGPATKFNARPPHLPFMPADNDFFAVHTHPSESRSGSKLTPTLRSTPSQAYPYSNHHLGTAPKNIQSHQGTPQRQPSDSHSRSSNLLGRLCSSMPTVTNNYDTRSSLPAGTQIDTAAVSTSQPTRLPSSGSSRAYDNVKVFQTEGSQVRDTPLMLKNDLETPHTQNLIPLPQAILSQTSSTHHRHPPLLHPANPVTVEVSRIPSKESILNTPSSLAPALKPTASQTSIPTSFSSESRRRGLFSMFRTKDARAAKQLPKETVTEREMESKAAVPGNTTSDRETKEGLLLSRAQEPQLKLPAVPLGHASGGKSTNSKAFTPFRYLTSKRQRTVSAASLEAQDGTAANTVVGSPTTSIRSSQPPPIQLPPLRDPFLATQEWRKREAAEVREGSGGKVRRQRPGVVFDVDENPSEEKRPKFRASRSRT